MRLEGKKSNGTAHALVLWNGLPARVNQGFWLQVLLNSYLKELGDNTQLTIKFKASLDKSNVEAQAVVFPDRTYTIRALALVAPAITAAHDSKGVAIANGGITSDASVKLTGTANALLEVEIFDGTTSKGKVKAGRDI